MPDIRDCLLAAAGANKMSSSKTNSREASVAADEASKDSTAVAESGEESQESKVGLSVNAAFVDSP